MGLGAWKGLFPRRLADRIKAPVLLIHGTDDRSVPVSPSKRMASALKRAGKPHELILFEDGDHFLSREEHRIRYLQELERFLKKHL